MVWMFVSPQNSDVEILTHKRDGIRRWGLLGVMAHKGRTHMMGMSTELPTSSTIGGYNGTSAARSGDPTQHAGALSSHFQPPEL